MRSIFLSAIFLSAFFVSRSQSPVDQNAKQMTIEEAHQLNGTAEPTINGKPYSQYKAEQEKLKLQQAAEEKKNQQVIMVTKNDDGTPSSINTNAPVAKVQNNTLKPASIKPVGSNNIAAQSKEEPSSINTNVPGNVQTKNSVKTKLPVPAKDLNNKISKVVKKTPTERSSIDQ